MTTASNHYSMHGLSLHYISIIKEVLQPFVSRISKVGLFGSRATGVYRSNSDIDMVVYGEITAEDIDRLHSLFEESLLPFRVDIQAYNLLNYPPLKAHIDAHMLLLLESKDLA
jgi:uncharacterized protein